MNNSKLGRCVLRSIVDLWHYHVMVNRARGKGTAAESAVVEYLRTHGWPHAERRALNGSQDKGDIAGCLGLAIEVKYANAGIRMGTWIKETSIERLNARADHGILVMKPTGVGERQVASWLTAMMNSDFNQLWAKVLTAPEFTVTVVNDPPNHYDLKNLKWQLASKIKALSDPGREIMALTLRPPGTKDTPDAWYRVLALEQMVRLLHAAGYGDASYEETQAQDLQVLG